MASLSQASMDKRGGVHPHGVLGGPSCPKGPHEQAFSYYDDLSYVFRRDQATGAHTETFVDVRPNVSGGYEGFPNEDGNDMEIPTMYSQGLHMSPEDIMGI
ncbi:RING-H2 finger protein ATL66 [Cucumis melo var. makuwa]|uniref:RING-H2 finger protein ATL66 n=1 Tax=Cucumis melo var. makuwa TaxID=1194695 RepID=A0A5D3D3P6_CUCMM|nr:RING-H2 finger protein ATL66 [Cucumis melo var. makuwa]TYK17936.1 RING-H2 finger protein ATL66 [Cucumis melo var. makuwa]